MLGKKIYRFKTSTNYLKIIKMYHEIFGEKFKKKIIMPEIYNYQLHRIEIIKKIISKKNIKNYLEIGCDQDEVFSEIKVENKIGVDPNSGGTHRMTSDSFFLANSKLFDLIFIDGLHTYEQVKKDIINSLKCLKKNGLILVHDCFPFNYYDQAIPRAQKKWNGDVWKAITEFRTFDQIDVCVGSFDNGIGLIINKENKNKLTISDQTKITNFKKLTYEDYFYNFNTYLNLVNEEDFFNKINDS
tara:strand:+ start:380 stop:1108 length:729 start_codon:yes stop_codon:yes gene_type:complete